VLGPVARHRLGLAPLITDVAGGGLLEEGPTQPVGRDLGSMADTLQVGYGDAARFECHQE